jgi:hypothetical protein
VQAVQLLGTWNRIARGHVALSTGCSCGVGATGLMVQDFEEQIMEFLNGRHATGAGSITQLLSDLAKSPGKNAPAILADVQRTLDSFEQQHSGR